MATKKRVKKSTKKVYMTAPHEHRFWACNGLVLSNLNDLAKCLKKMDNGHFTHHVNSKKNDFANWVSDILHDKALASLLRKSKTRSSSLKQVEAKLK